MAWVEELGGWVVVSHELAVTVMRDSDAFTVDDPRFTTGQIIGPSMLTLDGAAHAESRAPFAHTMRMSEVRDQHGPSVLSRARALVRGLATHGRSDLRVTLAAPLAVEVVLELLGLIDVTPTRARAWYDDIVRAVDSLSAGAQPPTSPNPGFGALREAVLSAMLKRPDSLVAHAAGSLDEELVVSNAAVVMFGGIETGEGMIANLLWHVYRHPDQLAALRADRQLIPRAVEESLRLEPAASRVDRYATRAVDLGGASIERGDLVIVSLAGANRDPDVFSAPDEFDIARSGLSNHLTFARGPHACPGLHLARAEAHAALTTVVEVLPNAALDLDSSAGPHGLVFRKPRAVVLEWTPT